MQITWVVSHMVVLVINGVVDHGVLLMGLLVTVLVRVLVGCHVNHMGGLHTSVSYGGRDYQDTAMLM